MESVVFESASASSAWWSWVVMGLFFLVLEMLGTGGYLLVLGTAGIVTGLVAWPLMGVLGWKGQCVLFSLLSFSTVFGWYFWRRYRKASVGIAEKPPTVLNQRGSELIGRSFRLHEAIVDGSGAIRVGDSFWRINGPDLPSGSTVRVLHMEDGKLIVAAEAENQLER